MFREKLDAYLNTINHALRDMLDYIQEKYSCLSDADCVELIEEHGGDIKDIIAAYPTEEDAVMAEAFALGYVTAESERYFDWKAFSEDFDTDNSYICLSSGAVVSITEEDAEYQAANDIKELLWPCAKDGSISMDSVSAVVGQVLLQENYILKGEASRMYDEIMDKAKIHTDQNSISLFCIFDIIDTILYKDSKTDEKNGENEHEEL